MKESKSEGNWLMSVVFLFCFLGSSIDVLISNCTKPVFDGLSNTCQKGCMPFVTSYDIIYVCRRNPTV